MTKLYVICGHGAGDPGASGNGYTEAERVRVLGKRIKELGGDNVVLLDPTINWYKTKKCKTFKFPKGVQVLELHLDSFTMATAKGGHVLYNGLFKPDKYDKALANMIAKRFPGRAEKMVGTSQLFNLNVLGNRGISARLLECCFITNKADITKFNNEIDELASDILKCFGITPKSPEKPKKEYTVYRVQVGSYTKKENAEKVQKMLKEKGYSANIVKAVVK